MLRVLTANLFNGRTDPDSLADVLDSLRPDVVAAQELAPSAAEVISARYPHGLIRPAEDYTGMALATRHPTSVERRPLPHRDAMSAKVQLGDGTLEVWCVHLANPVNVPPTTRARRDQVQAVESGIAGTHPLLLVGDLNSTPIWPAYQRLTRHLDDGVLAWAKSEDRRPSRTWNYWWRLPALLRIDHALIRGATVTRAQIARIKGGDHRALLVDVE